MLTNRLRDARNNKRKKFLQEKYDLSCPNCESKFISIIGQFIIDREIEFTIKCSNCGHINEILIDPEKN